jgi:hypothetical protein
MPSFDAGAVVESLDWDFTKAGVKAKGTVPEPSDKAIGKFLDDLKKVYEDAQKSGLTPDLTDELGPDQMLDALANLTGDAFVGFMAKIAGLFAELCSNTPSTEQLLGLPMRVRVKFYAWIQNEVVNPEAETGAGNAVVRSLPSGRAG